MHCHILVYWTALGNNSLYRGEEERKKGEKGKEEGIKEKIGKIEKLREIK